MDVCLHLIINIEWESKAAAWLVKGDEHYWNEMVRLRELQRSCQCLVCRSEREGPQIDVRPERSTCRTPNEAPASSAWPPSHITLPFVDNSSSPSPLQHVGKIKRAVFLHNSAAALDLSSKSECATIQTGVR